MAGTSRLLKMDKFEKILESIEDPVIVVSEEGNVLFMNQAGYILSSQLGSKSFKKLITYPFSLSSIKKKMSVKGIFKEINNNKFLIDAFPFGEKSLTLLIRDITRFIEFEELSKKEGLIITVSKLLSSIFHDMKGPVGGIKGAAQLLKEDTTDEELIEDILYEVKRLENMINEITTITKPIRLNKRKVNIHKIIDKAIKNGYTMSIGGDVSEPGFDRTTQCAIIPTFDIPQQYIDDNARAFRFLNHTTTDDHGMHLVGYTTYKGQKWYLIKDSSSGSRNNDPKAPEFGYYFFRQDYVKLKMMDIMVHKDMLKDYMNKFNK
jgi:hypothetical protein